MTRQTPPAELWIVLSPSGDIKAATRFKIVAKWAKQRGDKMFRYRLNRIRHAQPRQSSTQTSGSLPHP